MNDVQLNGQAQLNDRAHIIPMGAGLHPGVPAEAAQEEYMVNLGDLLRVVWRRLWVIVLVAALLAGSAVGFSFWQTPVYEASIQILVGQKQNNDTPVSNLGADVMGLQQLTQTVAEVVHTRTVAEAVIEREDLRVTPEDFLENMTVEQVPETQVIEVSYQDTDPARAQRISNAIGEVFSEQISEVSTSANSITATVWEQASAPDSPVSPNPLRDGVLALVLGVMLGLGLAFLVEYLYDDWRSPEEAERVSGVPTFGVIRGFETPKAKKQEEKAEPAPEKAEPAPRTPSLDPFETSTTKKKEG